MDILSWFWPLSLGLFGLLFGSFANVLIWRFPRGESVAFPGSHCPTCGHAIRWFDNVPILSWLVLRGKCRDCGSPIAIRYPLVELLSGLLWAGAGLRFGPTAQSVLCAVFFYVLLVLTFIDLDTFRLPNAIVATLAVGGVTAAVVSQLTGIALAPLTLAGGATVGVSAGIAGWLGGPLVSALAGAALGAGLSGGIAALYSRTRGRTGLGMGDVKLLGAMGLFLGPYVLLALFAGSLAGVVGGLAGAVHSGESATARRIPFGPYLALGGVLVALAGPATWAWYLAVAHLS